MTFNEFIIRLYGKEKPEWSRLGQWAFNTLHEVKPVLANEIRGTKFDPFYQDSRIGDFLVEVAEKWSAPVFEDQPTRE